MVMWCSEQPPNGSRLSCGALKKDSFHNLRAPPASSACYAALTRRSPYEPRCEGHPHAKDRNHATKTPNGVQQKRAIGLLGIVVTSDMCVRLIIGYELLGPPFLSTEVCGCHARAVIGMAVHGVGEVNSRNIADALPTNPQLNRRGVHNCMCGVIGKQRPHVTSRESGHCD